MPRALGALALGGGLFSFVQWLARSLQMARQRFPRRGEPEVCLVVSHAKRLQINERENRRRAPEDAGAVRRAGDGRHQCAPNHEGLAGPAARRRRRQSAEGRLRHRQRSGRASHAGKRAELRASGATEAHPLSLGRIDPAPHTQHLLGPFAAIAQNSLLRSFSIVDSLANRQHSCRGSEELAIRKTARFQATPSSH